eukprot:gene47333-57982_t
MLEQISWAIPKGEFHCLVGRSGCGKTTLLKMAAGLLRPFAGQVVIGAETVAGPSAQAGFVFQAPTLLEWESVLGNILLPLSLRRRVRAEDREKAEALLDLVSLSGYGARHPRALSGGEQSRVAIATDYVALNKALGGGWDDAPAATAQAQPAFVRDLGRRGGLVHAVLAQHEAVAGHVAVEGAAVAPVGVDHPHFGVW